ncbi:DUF3145 family protein, partial [Mycobacterium tuberculosis]|nr:DUF3145 family protein [Mycobacterium tuberculosis]
LRAVAKWVGPGGTGAGGAKALRSWSGRRFEGTGEPSPGGGGERVDGLAVLRDPGQGPLAQRHLRVATGHVDHLGEGEGVGIEIDDSGHREPFFCVGRTGRSCRGGRVGRGGRT